MFTEIACGTFISDGTAHLLLAPLGCNYVVCDNETVLRAQSANRAFRTEWDSNMRVNDSTITYFAGAAPAINMAKAYEFPGANYQPGYTYIDTSAQAPIVQGTFTATSNAANPQVTTTAVNIPAGQYGTTGMITNRTVVRLSYPAPAALGAAPTIMGIDYSVTVDNATHFTLPTHATALPLGAGGTFSIVSYDSDPIFYPSTRTIINATVGLTPTITTSVVHNYLVGQKIRFNIPASCGMVQLDGLEANITAVPAANTFVIDQSTLGFTAFAWPLLAAYPCQFASCVPSGKTGTITYAYTLGGAQVCRGSIGLILGVGNYSPAGLINDVIHYRIGKYAELE